MTDQTQDISRRGMMGGVALGAAAAVLASVRGAAAAGDKPMLMFVQLAESVKID